MLILERIIINIILLIKILGYYFNQLYIKNMINKGAESLPNKDAQAYRQLAKFYDSKNYKKGLKNADKLLETHPEHPETNALKALFLIALNQQNKALEVAKFGLMKSKLKSMFCWHTCATIYKQKKDFQQSAKCFANALRLQPDNIQLMRQTAALQIQVRDHANHTNMRFNILKQKPNMIQNWVGFTIAHHLRGDFPSLFKALVSLDNLIKTTQLKPTELAHYYVYRVIAYRDAKDWEGMYEQLKRNKANIKDETTYHELRYECCYKLNKLAQAQQQIQILLKKYPENIDYLRNYQKLNQLSNRQVFVKAQKDYQSKIAQVYELCYIEDSQQFKQQFSTFIKPYYQKNLISLYTEIQCVYEAGKNNLIEQIFLSYEQHLSKEVYPDQTAVTSPSEYLWSLYMLAQHYQRKFQTLNKAHQYIVKAIKHTCTVSQFYLIKAQIQYRQHKNLSAVKTINEARKTDLADRYMNNICVKYLLKCDKPDLGQNVFRLFMRDDSSLYELQNQWYIIETGKSLLKQRNIEAGLRHLNFVAKQFLDFLGNEFDFHTYCLRKWTLKEYTQLIEFNDNIYDDKKFVEAASWAIKYLKQYIYKIEQDEKKAKILAEQATKQENVAKKKKKKKKNAQQEIVEEDPKEAFRKKNDYYGKQYCQTIKKNPLQQALNYAKSVATIKYTNKENKKENKLFGRAFQEAIDIFIHFKKPLLVLRLINKLKRTRFCPFSIHFSLLKTIIYFNEYLLEPKANDIAKQLINQFLKDTLKGKSVVQFNTQQVSQWSTKVDGQHLYLLQIKKREADIIIKGINNRSEYILYYSAELTKLSLLQEFSSKDLQAVFYLTHKLQFYGQLSQQTKKTLNDKLIGKVQYFSDWRQQIKKFPESAWTMWWLSDYDIQRQQLEEKKQRQEKIQGKQETSSQKKQETKQQSKNE